MRKIWTHTKIVIGATLITLLALDLGVRVYDKLTGHGFVWDHRNPLYRDFKPVIPWRVFGFTPFERDAGNRFIVSSHGRQFPFDKPAGSVRIVCFGGSTTNQDVDGVHYPLALEKLLRQRTGSEQIEVINLGYPAYATPHSLTLLEFDAISWDVDIAIFSHNFNDLSVMYWPDFRPDYSNKYENEYYSVPDYSERFTTLNVLFQHSKLYWVLWQRWQEYSLVSEETPPLQRQSYGPSPAAEAAAVFRRNLETFVTLARANGIAAVLGNQPLEPSQEFFEHFMAHKPYNDIIVYPLHEEYVQHHRAYNNIIEEVATETGAVYVDNDAALGGKSELFLDFVHYQRPGIDALAQSYAEALMREGLVAPANVRATE